MTGPPGVRTDTASRFVAAAPETLYRAFVDAEALMAWLPPDGMRGRALEFDPRPGGRYRIELTYEPGSAPGGVGKTGDRKDVSMGCFLALEPGRRIVQSVAFESDDPAFAGEMIVTWSLAPVVGGSLVTVTAENVPAGIPEQDHQAGLDSSLKNLARFVAARDDTSSA